MDCFAWFIWQIKKARKCGPFYLLAAGRQEWRISQVAQLAHRLVGLGAGFEWSQLDAGDGVSGDAVFLQVFDQLLRIADAGEQAELYLIADRAAGWQRLVGGFRGCLGGGALSMAAAAGCEVASGALLRAGSVCRLAAAAVWRFGGAAFSCGAGLAWAEEGWRVLAAWRLAACWLATAGVLLRSGVAGLLAAGATGAWSTGSTAGALLCVAGALATLGRVMAPASGGGTAGLMILPELGLCASLLISTLGLVSASINGMAARATATRPPAIHSRFFSLLLRSDSSPSSTGGCCWFCSRMVPGWNVQHVFENTAKIAGSSELGNPSGVIILKFSHLSCR
ncbi:hypothetical protein BI347_05935 [Chromobacterium sphagni]|uniref:Uncharacterized protein n=1 Tax=Chromobacterium sphagni TaxID=1903179 RepID=A0A1S1X0Z9_9NEIS|nr:hypothetical protein BI347_05935 [Chromobacterium sphagni]